MKMYLLRILHDKIKLTIAIILLLLPSLEVVQIWWQVHLGFSMPDPHYATFLSLFTLRHYLHKIIFWYLPIFLLLIVNEDSIEDYELGYRHVLTVREGRNRYLKTKLTGSFLVSFSLICLGLLLNMVLVYICFRDGSFSRSDFANDMSYLDYDISRITVTHPIAANLVYIFLTSALAGLLGAAGTMLAITLHQRKLVYGITFLLWFIPVMSRDSLMYVIQPFITVNFDQIMPTLIGVIVCYVLTITATVIMEVKDDRL